MLMREFDQIGWFCGCLFKVF